MLLVALHLIHKLAGAVVLSLLLLLLELPEILRRCWVRATSTLYRHPPSTTRLLLLPPELRHMIWTMLFEDFDSVWVMRMRPKSYTSYSERLRLYMGTNPEYSIRWFSTRPTTRLLHKRIAFIQSCCQNLQ